MKIIKWIYERPTNIKHTMSQVLIHFLCGILGGHGIAQFIITKNPLYIILWIPFIFDIGMLWFNVHKSTKRIREIEENFKKEHGGVDMWTYMKNMEKEDDET